jgi:ATP-binding cassette subfamily B protein
MKELLNIFKFSKHLWKYYLLIAVLTLVTAILGQAAPLITQRVIDGISKGSISYTSLVVLSILYFGAGAGTTFISNISGYHGDIMAVKLEIFLADKFYQKILALPQSYFDEELTGTIVNRLNRSTVGLSTFIKAFSNNFFPFIATTFLSLGIVFYYSWQVGLLLTSLFPIYVLLTTRSSTLWQKYENISNKLKDTAAGRFQESISSIKTIKSFTSESREHKFFVGTLNKLIPNTKKQSFYWHRKDVERRFIVDVIFGIIFLVIAGQLFNGSISIGKAVALLQFSAMIRIPLFTVSFLVDNFQKAITSSKDYFLTMKEVEEISNSKISETQKVLQSSKIAGQIKFKDVSFAYQNAEPIFSKISFIVQPGQKVAIVGESGQGKTTLAHLLLKFYTPTSGAIKLDGVNLEDIQTSSLRQSIGLVLQEPALFSGTIYENIAYGNPKATEKDVQVAAKAANAAGFILKFKHGYKSFIGERGVKLSGGQKQRIAIARTILKDAPILILDEATSSLDSKAEHEVQVALDNLMKHKTTIIIAHRFSTISSADLIVTLKGGKVDEVGPPAELAKTGGVYAELLKLQTVGTKKAKKALEKFDIN